MSVEIITYIPLIILVILFRRTKPWHNKAKQLDRALKNLHLDIEKNEHGQTKMNPKKYFRFPCAFKIVLYLFSLTLMGISSTFVLFKGSIIRRKKIQFILNFYFIFLFNRKGVELGDEQVKHWLVSLIITILTGIFVTQPFQVYLNHIYILHGIYETNLYGSRIYMNLSRLS